MNTTENLSDRIPTGISDAVICAASVLVCSFWSYEGYMSKTIMLVMNLIAAFCMIAAWFWYSFANGIKKKKWFPVFTGIFWLLPLTISLVSDTMTDPRKYNAWLKLAGELSKLLGRDAFMSVPVLKNIDSVFAVLIFLALSIGAYIMGVMMVRNRPSGNKGGGK